MGNMALMGIHTDKIIIRTLNWMSSV